MTRHPVIAAMAMLALSACGSSTNSSTSMNYPYLTPPVQRAAPKGLQTNTSAGFFTLDDSGFKDRFFSDGPTYIFGVLGSVDQRIAGLKQQVSSGASCTGQTPTAYTIHPPSGDVTLYAQCYQTVSTPGGDSNSFVQWGVKDDTFYLYTSVGAEHLAAVATPGDANATDPNNYNVHIWFGVGYTNNDCGTAHTWDGCSYGMVELTADPNIPSFEMAVAGIGFGYCGAQLKSDGVAMYAEGSTDMGSTCNTTDTLCVQSSDATTPVTCTNAQQTFALTPMGRTQSTGSGSAVSSTWAASDYPGTSADQVVLNGTASDALGFGPTSPTAGVAALN